MKRPIKLCWSRSKPNFGDRLSPMIVEAVSGRKVKYAPQGKCDLVALGSLLHRLEEKFWTRRVHIWGAGFIEERPERVTRHHVHAVRGELSREIIGSMHAPIGDPGLLVDRVFGDRVDSGKRYSLAVIPHYKDKGDPRIRGIVERFAGAVEVDIFSPPMEILNAIAGSEMVLSSAMHGLITADSLGVPNAWIELSSDVKGGGFKFRDYYSVFGMEAKSVSLSEGLEGRLDDIMSSWCRPGIEKIKDNLEYSFPII